jgi:gas vesicle protein
MDTGKLIGGILAGVAAGILAGILLAPEKGENLRSKIAKKGTGILTEGKDKLNDLSVSVTDKLKTAETEANTLYEKGKKEVKSQLS